MKRLLVTAFLALSTAALFAGDHADSIESAKEKAAANNKQILVDIYMPG